MRQPSAEDIAEIEPYSGQPFKEAVERLTLGPHLPTITQHFFPNVDLSELIRMAKSMPDGDAFTKDIMSIAVKSLVNRTTKGITTDGFASRDPNSAYLFLSNHRDIIGDAALTSLSLVKMNLKPPMICLGDNLLFDSWSNDLLKVSKGVIVKRNLSQRELLRWSGVLSHVIHSHVSEGRDSIWLAQREGRAKDGKDLTNPGILKMLALGSQGAPVDHLRQLNIVPTSISYEWDPCDVFKARELVLLKQHGTYLKVPGEDRQSMILGMMGQKGRVHITLGKGLNEACEQAAREPNRKAQIEFLVEAIDEQIIRGYKLWPSNFIASDLLEGLASYSDSYTEAEKKEFTDRLAKQMSQCPDVPPDPLRRTVLEIYANPVYARKAFEN